MCLIKREEREFRDFFYMCVFCCMYHLRGKTRFQFQVPTGGLWTMRLPHPGILNRLYSWWPLYTYSSSSTIVWDSIPCLSDLRKWWKPLILPISKSFPNTVRYVPGVVMTVWVSYRNLEVERDLIKVRVYIHS